MIATDYGFRMIDGSTYDLTFPSDVLRLSVVLVTMPADDVERFYHELRAAGRVGHALALEAAFDIANVHALRAVRRFETGRVF
jgi:hypothetical protein